MSTYTYLSAQQAAVGTGVTTVTLTGAATNILGTALTLTNVLTAKVLATVTINTGASIFNRAYQVPINPGETIYPMRGEHWVLPTGYILAVASDTASSIDVVFSYVTIT